MGTETGGARLHSAVIALALLINAAVFLVFSLSGALYLPYSVPLLMALWLLVYGAAYAALRWCDACTDPAAHPPDAVHRHHYNDDEDDDARRDDPAMYLL